MIAIPMPGALTPRARSSAFAREVTQGMETRVTKKVWNVLYRPE